MIVQNGIANRHSPITIVAAITPQFEEPLYPTEVLILAREGGLQTDSVVLLNQIRSIDKQRLGRRLGKVAPPTMEKIDRALMASLGLVKLELLSRLVDHLVPLAGPRGTQYPVRLIRPSAHPPHRPP